MSKPPRDGKGDDLFPKTQATGPNGRPLCRVCKREVPPRKRTFCSHDCIHKYSIRTSSAYARRCVGERDRGVCALCKLDTARLERIFQYLVCYTPPRWFRDKQEHDKREALKWWRGGGVPWEKFTDAQAAAYKAFCRRHHHLWLDEATKRYPWAFTRGLRGWYVKHLWEMDHIVPVSEGGGSCGLENLRTLCVPCHREVTKQLRGRLAGSNH